MKIKQGEIIFCKASCTSVFENLYMGEQRFMFNNGMHYPRSMERMEMVFGGSCGVIEVIKLTNLPYI